MQGIPITIGRLARYTVVILLLVSLAFVGGTFFYGTKTVRDLLASNEKLKQAITALTHEDQVGFAKVMKQETRDGRLYTTVKFVETARDDASMTRVLEKEYEIEGDIIHFDALLVTFKDQMVMDGKARSLYLWRRIYGERMTPADGFDIEGPGTRPARYAELLRELKQSDQQLFWDAIWDLANDPEALSDYGIRAVFGNVVYMQMRPGFIYIFRIRNDGQIYPETVLDM